MIRYVIRWALTTGIRKVDGSYTDSGKYFSDGRCLFVSSSETYESLEEAEACAREMAKKRAKRLREQAKKFESADWKPKVVEA
jgi:hypothetical protein